MGESASIIEWHVAGRPVAGEERSGDQGLVLVSEHDALVAAVDGVGRGAAAASAARAAIDALRVGPRDDVAALAEQCHEALRPTRGAAIGLAAFRGDATVTWLGVGNVTAKKLRARSLTTVADVARLDEDELIAILGRGSGRHLHALAHNRDPRPVEVGKRRHSIGTQRALGRRARSPDQLDVDLIALVDRLARRLRTPGPPTFAIATPRRCTGRSAMAGRIR